MAENYLITGYWGEPHVTAENDRGINAATFGEGRLVLPVGERFKAEYIGNNTIRMYDGKLVDNGAAAGIPAGEYVDLLISNAGQGMKRNDIIAFQYSQDSSTLVESGTFVVIQGAETSGTATDPELTQDDLLSNTATFDQMALWRVSVSGATISAPVQMFASHDFVRNACGTWTPAINCISAPTAANGWYQKVGNVVTIGFYITGTTDVATSTTTNNRITGVPFTPDDSVRWYGGGGNVTNVYTPASQAFCGFVMDTATSGAPIMIRTAAYGTSAGLRSSGYAYCPSSGGLNQTVHIAGTLTYLTKE